MIPPDTTSKDRTVTSTADSPETPDQLPRARSDRSQKSAGHTVDVKDLHAYYGEQHAIKGINLDFPANEVTAIIGPSGCGKSTMVRCINRMHEEIPGRPRRGQRHARRPRRL